MGAVGKLFRLSRDDRWLLLQALVAVAAAGVTVRLLSPAAVLKKVSGKAITQSRNSLQSSVRIAWAISIAARYVPGSKCLVQAIAGRQLLAKYGFPSEIHIGVLKDSRNWLSAHAWVEAEGKTVIGGDITAYVPLLGAHQEYRP